MAHDFSDLPADPEEAFLLLEEQYRKECEEAINDAGRDENLSIFYTDYIAQVLGAVEELELMGAAFGTQDIPSIHEVSFASYQDFSKRVKHYTTRLAIRRARRVQGHSVRFDATTKTKVHYLLGKIRSIFEQIEVNDGKRDALFAKLNALEAEVDRTRTRFEAYAALAIEVADVSGEVVERSKILEVLDSVARLFGAAAKQDTSGRLPSPEKPKQIEHKKNANSDESPDDDIPF